MNVSIIIVNYKNPPLIIQCVKSILEFEKSVSYEIIVVDNNSEDDTEQQLRVLCPNLKWVQMGYNSGFAKANNAGFNIAEGDFILYLNSDTIFIEPVLESIITGFCEDSGVGMLGCRLVSEDLKDQVSCNSLNYSFFFKQLYRRNPFMIKFFHTKATSDRELEEIGSLPNKTRYLPWIIGAMVFMKKSDIEKYHLLWDEDFFMYQEDVELGYRVNKAGLKVKYMPSPKIIHLCGASSNDSLAFFQRYETSKLIYIEKLYGRLARIMYKRLFVLELRLEGWLERRKFGEIKSKSLANELEYYGLIKR